MSVFKLRKKVIRELVDNIYDSTPYYSHLLKGVKEKMNYKNAITDSMELLGKNKKVVFLGEGLINAGRIYGTLDKVPLEKCIEFPIAENLIMGAAVGLAIDGYLPVVVFQRMDFMTIASDQIINHLSLIPKMSGEKIKLPVIIRTIIGSQCSKFDVGCQHNKDLTDVFNQFIEVQHLPKSPNLICDIYKRAVKSGEPIMIVEDKDLYA